MKVSLVLRRCRHLGVAVAVSLAAAGSAFAQSYHVQKSTNYLQTGPGAPALDPIRTYEFYAGFPPTLTSPVLTTPAGQTVPLFKGSDGYETSFQGVYLSNKTAFDAAFPAGNYTLTSSGREPVVMNMGPDLYPTTVPQITNGTWNAGGLLVLNPAQANTITINTFAGYATAGVGGYVGITAEGDTSEPEANSLTASVGAFAPSIVAANPVTSLVIPARTFTSGRVYAISVEFFTALSFATSAVAPNGVFTGNGSGTKIYVAALAPGTNAVPAPVIARQPTDITARVGTTATFTIGVTFNGSTQFPANGTFFADWYFKGSYVGDDPRFAGTNGAQLVIRNVTAADAGEYSYRIVTTGGIATSNIVKLTVTNPPTIAAQPASRTVVSGTTTVFSVAASGSPEPTYQWQRNGTLIAGATSAMLVIPGATAANAGNYTAVVTNSQGTVTSNAATLAISDSPDFGRIVNLSILTSLAAGEGNFTVGTVIGGARTSGTKPILVRAAGPTLGAAPFNITGVLPDPKLDLYSGSTVVASNDNWAGAAALTTAFTSVGAFPYVNATARDAAYFNPALPAGAYTVQVADAGTGTGAVIAELYDSTPGASFTATTPRLVNVSVLKQIPAGALLTTGFVIGGSTAKTVLIRAVGPTLAGAPFNIGDAMVDPQLVLFNAASAQIASNDNWGGDAQLAGVSGSVGAFALSGATSRDAVLLVTLPPGSYTAQASGVGSSGGRAIVEVYEVP